MVVSTLQISVQYSKWQQALRHCLIRPEEWMTKLNQYNKLENGLISLFTGSDMSAWLCDMKFFLKNLMLHLIQNSQLNANCNL